MPHHAALLFAAHIRTRRTNDELPLFDELAEALAFPLPMELDELDEFPLSTEAGELPLPDELDEFPLLVEVVELLLFDELGFAAIDVSFPHFDFIHRMYSDERDARKFFSSKAI